MKRVRKNSLEFRGDSYYFKDELYTGFVYTVIGAVVENIFYVEKGIISDKPNDVFGFEKYSTSIDASHMEEELEVEPFLYEGGKFTGVAYDFENEFCVGAMVFADGYLVKEVGWLKSGILGFYERFAEGVGEFATWNENGARNNYKLSGLRSFRLEADFTAQNEMRRLSVFGPFSENLSASLPKALFPVVESLEQLREIKLSDSLYLSGDGVDSEVFSALLGSIHFEKVKSLHVSNSSLSGKCISDLKTMENIKELILDDDREEVSIAIGEFRRERPDCVVQLNQ